MGRATIPFAIVLAFLACATGAGAEVPEGTWLAYQGTLKVTTQREGEEPRELSAALQVKYLGLGEEVLLLRSADFKEDKDLSVREAVTLDISGGRRPSPVFPVEDRVFRVSPVLFKYLPLWTLSLRAGRLHVLFFPEPKDVKFISAVGFDPKKNGGDSHIANGKTTFFIDRVEVPFEITKLEVVSGPLLFKHRLEGKLGEDSVEHVRVEIDLKRDEAQDLDAAAFKGLAAEARELKEIERALFASLDGDAAEAKAAAFKKAHPESRLAPFAAGLAAQADTVRKIAGERKLYGKPALDFTLPDLSGKPVTLSALLPGKVTLLSFWAVG